MKWCSIVYSNRYRGLHHCKMANPKLGYTKIRQYVCRVSELDVKKKIVSCRIRGRDETKQRNKKGVTIECNDIIIHIIYI